MTRQDAEGLVSRHRHGRTEVLTVHPAELYQAQTIEALARDLRRAVEAAGASQFVLDLSAVRFMTSAAVGLLINMRAHLADRGYVFALAGATGEVAHVLECTRLASVMPVYPTLDAALEAMNVQRPADGT